MTDWIRSLSARETNPHQAGAAYMSRAIRVARVTSHTRTVVRECFKGDEASQWKRPKFDPSPHQNPLTDRSSPKLAGVITS